MPAPTDAGRVTSNTSANLSSHTIYLGSPAAGQLLVLVVRTGLSSTIDVPGFTLLGELVVDGSGDTMQVLTKVATGTEGDSVTATTSASCKLAAICWRITNGESPTLGTVATGSGTNNANPGSASPAGAPRDTLYLATMGHDGELNEPTAGPAGYTNYVSIASGVSGGTATNLSLAGASKAALASSSDDAGAFTHPTSWLGWTAVTVAVRYKAPAPATGASSGKPGTFTPPGGTIPANLAAMSSITASPSTPWYDGEYVVLGDASEASWNGSAWVVGRGTGGPAPAPVGAIQAAWATPAGQPVTSAVVTLPNPVTAGDLIVVGYTRDRSAAGTDTCADNRGTVYGAPVAIADNTNNAQEYNLWAGIAPTTGTYTITVSLPSSSYVTIVAATFAAITSATPNAANNVTNKNGAAGTDGFVGPTITTTVDGCLIVALVGLTFGEANIQAGTGYVEGVDTGNPGSPSIQLESRVQAAKGSITPTWTVPTNTFDAIVAAFPRAVAPTGIAVKRWSGSAWVAATVKRWSGSAWVTTTPKRRDADGTWK